MELSTLWQQILAAPGDEDLKSRYIQALKRAGDPRAEIFRLAEALQDFPPYYVQHEALARQYESSLEHWRTDFDAPTRKWNAEVIFVGGWPIEVTIDAGDFCRYAAEIVATLPLRHLNLREAQVSPEVFSVPQMSQIVSLDGSHYPWSPQAITALAASTQLPALRWLNLSATGITDAEVEILASSPQFKELVYLSLQDNPCRDPVDAAAGYGVDGITGYIVNESIWLPAFGKELEARYGRIGWLHSLEHFMENHPPNRYQF